MSNNELRFRQMHLDFHTSEHIPGIGAEFDPEEFAATLERARVDSITCFARCHHGWIYFDTETHPERRHPHLSRDLLAEQIQACHARNIRVPIYTTVQWDHLTADQHPEWRVVTDEGCLQGTPPYEAGFYRKLCVNSPYRNFLKEHTQEILETLPVDGFFYDIVQPTECSCGFCRAAMEEEGLEPSDAESRWLFGIKTINDFKLEMSDFVRRYNSDCTIFYNAGHIGTKHRQAADAYTHFELESLPSGGWGYLHFPVTMRYARTLGPECLGQTGKFHTSWGDFHSFKNPAALQYECYRMLALGAKCMIGDQLDPTGRVDRNVYDLIGGVYAEVEKKEPWCSGAKAVTEIAVFTPEEFAEQSARSLTPPIRGVTRMLEEGAHQFDIVDSASDLSDYRAVVLPDYIPVSQALSEKLKAYLADGGAIIASFASGMNAEETVFTLGSPGVRLQGEGERTSLAGELVRGRHFPHNDFCDYILPGAKIGRGLPETEHAMYMRGMEVTAEQGCEVLAETVQSYFDRTYQHFCSHRQTPSSGRTGAPAIVRRDRSIYFAHPIFTQYDQNAPRWCKTLFLNALDLLLPEPLVSHDGPTTAQIAVNEQVRENRWVLHLLHYVPERRGGDFDIIEDVIPLFDVRLSVRVQKKIEEVTCVPSNEAMDFEQENGRVKFVLPRLDGHQMVALNFAE